MSGPKGYGYTVVSQEELRRREDEARSGQCRQHAITLAGLVAQLRHLGGEAPKAVKEPASKDHDSLIAWEHALQRAISAAEQRVREESAKAILRRLNKSMEAVDASVVSLGGTRVKPAPASARPPAEDGDRNRMSLEINRVATLVANLRDPSQREELTRMAESVLATPSRDQARGDLLTLKTKVIAALEAQECRDLAVEAVAAVAGIESPEASGLRERASHASTMQDVTSLRRDAEALAQIAARSADAAFVQSALEDVLAELGFTVGEGFELSDFGPVAVADHADHPGYGLRIQINPNNGRLFTRLVADDDTSADEDAQAERDSCEKVHAVADALRRRGVAAQLATERQPGDTVVEKRLAATDGRAAQKRTQIRRSRRPGVTRERTR